MTRAEIIDRMGWHETADRSMSDIITRIERIVRAAETAEREACARACDNIAACHEQQDSNIGAGAAKDCAEIIRARGET